MHTLGVDIIEIFRVKRAVSRWGERFLRRLYTPAELELCQGKVSSLAVRFAAKEAVRKALGTSTQGIGWREIEVLSDDQGKPVVQLYGRAKARAHELGIYDMAISLSHSQEYAVSFVVASY